MFRSQSPTSVHAESVCTLAVIRHLGLELSDGI